MTLESLGDAWNKFFFEPEKPTPIALYRIAFGVLVLLDTLQLRPDWLIWFGPHGLLTVSTMHQLAAGSRINVFAVLPETDGTTNAVFWVLLISAAFVTVGWMTRLSIAVVFVCLTSLHQRDLFITNAGDALLRLTAFFLVLAPAGAVLSVDRLLRIWRGKETSEVPLRAPWAQRMIQIQVCLAYCSTFWLKSQSSYWMDGSALYYTYHLEQLYRLPFPRFWLTVPTLLKLACWATLALEFSLGVLVWFRDVRYKILLCGLLFHAIIEYSMSIPLFEWVMCSTYLTFVYPEDLTQAWKWVCARLERWLPAPLSATYDPRNVRVARTVELLRALDVFGRLRFAPRDAADASGVREGLVVATALGPRTGRSGIQVAARALPLLWVVAWPWIIGGYRKPRAET